MEITFKNSIKIEYFVEIDGDEFQCNDLNEALKYIQNTNATFLHKELEELANFIMGIDAKFKAYRITALVTLDDDENETIHLRKSF